MSGVVPPLSHTSAWGGAYFSTRKLPCSFSFIEKKIVSVNVIALQIAKQSQKLFPCISLNTMKNVT
jgi:hypothetical protein